MSKAGKKHNTDEYRRVAAETEDLLQPSDTELIEEATIVAGIDDTEPLLDMDEHYLIEEEIARGGMGAILRATDRELRRDVAMKVLLHNDPDHQARFYDEAQITGQLEHPNIVPVHRLGEDEKGHPYLIMKLVKGKSLAELLSDITRNPKRALQHRYALPHLLGHFVGVCNAIAYAHASGVIHRDLKPANVMIGDFGEVQVMDWGLARTGMVRNRRSSVRLRRESTKIKLPVGSHPPKTKEKPASVNVRGVRTNRADTHAMLTMQGKAYGTPAYMSPEQARGENNSLDERTDIYALGTILYQILTLKPPVEETELQSLLDKVAAGDIAPPERRAPERSIPPELSAICMKALANDPEERYQRAEDLRDDIELYLEGMAVSARDDNFLEMLLRIARRHRAAVVVGFFSALLLAVTLSVSYHSNQEIRALAELERHRTESMLFQWRRDQLHRKQQQQSSAPAFLKQAEEALARHDAEGALQNLDVACRYDESLTRACYLKACLLARRGDHEKALATLLGIAPESPEAAPSKALAALCRSGIAKGHAAIEPALSAFFQEQGLVPLVDTSLLTDKQVETHYRKQIAKARPSLARYLSYNKKDCRLEIRSRPNLFDLTFLQGIPLTELVLVQTSVTRLAPLAGMPLRSLHLEKTPANDLQTLLKLPLETLVIAPGDYAKETLRVLRGHPHLKHIAIPPEGKVRFSAKSFWKRFDAGAFDTGIEPQTTPHLTP